MYASLASVFFCTLAIGVFSICSVQNTYAQPQNRQFNLFSNEIVSKLSDRSQQVIENFRKRRLNAEMRVARIQNFNQILFSKEVNFNLFTDFSSTVQQVRIEQTGENSYIWHGKSSRGERAMLSIHDKAIVGYVQDGKNLYEIQSIVDDICVIYRVDATQPYNDESEDAYKKSSSIVPPLQKGGGDLRTLQSSCNGRVVTVLVAYTNAALVARGNNVSSLQASANAWIADGNVANSNSGVDMTFQLAGLVATNFVETNSACSDATAAAANQEFINLRNNAMADVVVVIVNDLDASSFGCVNEIGATANGAFCVVLQGTPTGRFTFAHEIAHLIGARHDNDPTTTPAPYGHGYVLPDGNRTIMGVFPIANQRLQYWSNPNRFFNGYPMGTSGYNDNARLLNERTELVADFRDSYTTTINGPFQLSVGQAGTWNATTQGLCNSATFSYRWFLKSADPVSPNQWIGPLSTSTSYTTTMRDYDKYLSLRVDVSTSVGGSSSSYFYVTCNDCSTGSGGPLSAPANEPNEQAAQLRNTDWNIDTDALFQNSPNPFDNNSEIQFALSELKHIRLTVHDALGNEMLRLLDESRMAGQHAVTINANTLAPGIYSYRLRTPQRTFSKQFIVVK
jgi:hypothetical protein